MATTTKIINSSQEEIEETGKQRQTVQITILQTSCMEGAYLCNIPRE